MKLASPATSDDGRKERGGSPGAGEGLGQPGSSLRTALTYLAPTSRGHTPASVAAASPEIPSAPAFAPTHSAQLVVGEGPEQLALRVTTWRTRVRVVVDAADGSPGLVSPDGTRELGAALARHGLELTTSDLRGGGSGLTDGGPGTSARDDGRAAARDTAAGSGPASGSPNRQPAHTPTREDRAAPAPDSGRPRALGATESNEPFDSRRRGVRVVL